MSWRIYCVENTVKITDICAQVLFKVLKKERDIYDRNDIISAGKLYFNSDDMEHMDYVGNKAIIKILNKHKVNGVITFIDPKNESADSLGTAWMYHFYGDGMCTREDGKIGLVKGEVTKAYMGA